METATKRTILRIELWHGLLLVGLLASLGRSKIVEPVALVMGGLFMGLNFFLLSFGVSWVLTPLASKGKVKLGVALLVLKVAIFLTLLFTLFFRFEIDAISFSLGFSLLLLAIVVEAVRMSVKLVT
jgi:hypothetical protein